MSIQDPHLCLRLYDMSVRCQLSENRQSDFLHFMQLAILELKMSHYLRKLNQFIRLYNMYNSKFVKEDITIENGIFTK